MTKQDLLNNPVFKSAPDDAILCYYHCSVDDGENITFNDVRPVPNSGHYYPSLVARSIGDTALTKKDLLENSLFKRMKKDMPLTIHYESCTVLLMGDIEVGLLLDHFLILHEFLWSEGKKMIKVEDKNDNLVWVELKDVAFSGVKIFK